MMKTDLQGQLRLLAERAGERLKGVADESTNLQLDWYYELAPDSDWHQIPGASGTLYSHEVGLVLSWLAKAGYHWIGCEEKGIPQIVIHDYTSGHLERRQGNGDTLEQALTQAVMQLELGASDEGKSVTA